MSFRVPHRWLWLVGLVGLAVLQLDGPALGATIQIRGTVTSLVLVDPVPEAWEFTLEGELQAEAEDFVFRDPGYLPGAYYLRVRANAPVVLYLEGSGVTVDSKAYPASFKWSGTPGEGTVEQGICVLPQDAPCRFFSSGGPVDTRIDLADFYIRHDQPVASGALRGEVTVTVSI